jgi:hypothetical protein
VVEVQWIRARAASATLLQDAWQRLSLRIHPLQDASEGRLVDSPWAPCECTVYVREQASTFLCSSK